MTLLERWSGNLKRRNYAVNAAIILVCVGVYFHCLFYGITKSDDDVLITNNLAFLQHLPNLKTVFTTDAFYLQKSIDLYRPLQSATFILDAQWGRDVVFNAHLTNMILHILVCLTVLKLLRALQLREKIAFLGALIYAVHYLFMTTVAWLPARGDLLLALFSFLSLLFFIKAVNEGGGGYYLLHGICFTLAIFSKESAVVLPVVLALYLWAYDRGYFLRRRQLLLPLFYLGVQLGYFWLKSSAVVFYQGDTGIGPLLKNLRTLPETVAKLYLPVNMSTLPAYTLEATTAGCLIIAGLVGLLFVFRTKFDRRIFFCVGWMLLFMIPALFYYPVFYLFTYEHLDHRSYTSCFGLMLLSLSCVQAFELDSKRYFYPLSLLLLLFLASGNLYFSRSYANPAAFAMRAIRTNPNSALGYSIYGHELYLQGRDEEALDNLNQSVRIFGKWTPALHTRALIYRRHGDKLAALGDLDTIIAFEPAYGADIYILRAQTKIDLQDHQGAINDYRMALRLEPGSGQARAGLLGLQQLMGDQPGNGNQSAARRYNDDGIEAGTKGDFKGAVLFFSKALKADPGLQEANVNLGRALYELGKRQEACLAWRTARDHGSDSAAQMMQAYCGK